MRNRFRPLCSVSGEETAPSLRRKNQSDGVPGSTIPFRVEKHVLQIGRCSPPHHVREPKPHVLGARRSTPSRARTKTARAGGPGAEGNARALYGHFGKAFPVCMQSVRELRQSVLAYRFKQEGQKRKQIEKSKTKSDVIILRVWKGTRS